MAIVEIITNRKYLNFFLSFSISKNTHTAEIENRFAALSARARLAIAIFKGENARRTEKSNAVFFPKYFPQK
jgi:hypothetical protein